MASSIAVDGLPKPARFYLPELDIVRFFAFLAVFIYHSTGKFIVGSEVDSGSFGVDLFFVLSSYLITRLLLRERHAVGQIHLGSFYVRRILRIWPLYFFCIALLFFVSRLPADIISTRTIKLAESPMNLGCVALMAVFLFNFAPGFVTFPVMIGHLWSISVEEQFYMLWPSILRRIPERRIVMVPIAMFLVSAVARLMSPYLHLKVGMYFNTFTHLDPIAVGILIAILPEFRPRPSVRVALVLLGFTSWQFAARYCGLPFGSDPLGVSLGFPAAALGAGAFLMASLGTSSARSGSPAVHMMIYLGKISYGLYVYHWVIILAVRVFMLRVGSRWILHRGFPVWTVLPVYLLLAFGADLIVAAASYRWLESPFLKLKSRFTFVPSRGV